MSETKYMPGALVPVLQEWLKQREKHGTFNVVVEVSNARKAGDDMCMRFTIEVQ